MTYDETKHTRGGNPANTGEYSEKTNSLPGDVLGSDIPTEYTLRPSHTRGVFRLESDLTDPPATEADGWMTKTVRMGGEPHLNARQKAIAALFEDGEPTAELDALADKRTNATLLYLGSTGYPTVREGTVDRYNGKTILLAKGSSKKGHTVESLNVVAVHKGYGKGELHAARYNGIAATVPAVEKASIDGIPEYDGSGDQSDIAAVYLMDSPSFEGESTPGCLFLATDVQTGDQDDVKTIVNGYFWAPDGASATSEHGSYYLDALQNRGGRVRDYQPGALNFGDVMRGSLGADRQEAYRAVRTASR